MALTVSLKQFEGPLDLLLSLISKAKVDICDIFVSEITEQYLASLEGLGELDMDTASEFLTMAATLIEIKSRALLPRQPTILEEGEETPEQALIRRLQEYRAIKEKAEVMQDIEQRAQLLYSKLPEEYPLPPQSFQIEGLTLNGLVDAFHRLLRRMQEEEEPEVIFRAREIHRDHFTVEECMFRISAGVSRGPCYFTEMMSKLPTRDEMVTLFMAMLEMLKLGRVCVQQDCVFDDILLLPGKGDEDGAQ